jgi:hypothetical protein
MSEILRLKQRITSSKGIVSVNGEGPGYNLNTHEGQVAFMRDTQFEWNVMFAMMQGNLPSDLIRDIQAKIEGETEVISLPHVVVKLLETGTYDFEV